MKLLFPKFCWLNNFSILFQLLFPLTPRHFIIYQDWIIIVLKYWLTKKNLLVFLVERCLKHLVFTNFIHKCNFWLHYDSHRISGHLKKERNSIEITVFSSIDTNTKDGNFFFFFLKKPKVNLQNKSIQFMEKVP